MADEQVTVSGDTVTVHVGFAVEGDLTYSDAFVMSHSDYLKWQKRPTAERERIKRERYDTWRERARVMASKPSPPQPKQEPRRSEFETDEEFQVAYDEWVAEQPVEGVE